MRRSGEAPSKLELAYENTVIGGLLAVGTVLGVWALNTYLPNPLEETEPIRSNDIKLSAVTYQEPDTQIESPNVLVIGADSAVFEEPPIYGAPQPDQVGTVQPGKQVVTGCKRSVPGATYIRIGFNNGQRIVEGYVPPATADGEPMFDPPTQGNVGPNRLAECQPGL